LGWLGMVNIIAQAAPAEYNRRWWFSAAELSVRRPVTRMFSIL